MKLQSLKQRHEEHVRKHSSGARKFVGVSHKLVNDEQLESTEATGDAIHKMLVEVRDTRQMDSPYLLGGE